MTQKSKLNPVGVFGPVSRGGGSQQLVNRFTRLRRSEHLPFNSTLMASSVVSSGALVILEDLNPSSQHFHDGASLRVTGRLLEYSAETAIAVIADGNATLKIDTQHVKINYRLGSVYQFIGELLLKSGNEPLLKARVGRNVDGIDLNLYRQSLQLLKEFQLEQTRS